MASNYPSTRDNIQHGYSQRPVGVHNQVAVTKSTSQAAYGASSPHQARVASAAYAGASNSSLDEAYDSSGPAGDIESSVDKTMQNISTTLIPPDLTERSSTETSTFHTLCNICKCFAGAASFELPWAFKQSGALLGGVALILLAFLTNYTLKWLAMCGHYHPTVSKPTYPQIAEYAFGRPGFVAAWFGILAMTVGVCGSYLVFIGSQVSSLLQAQWPDNAQVARVFTPDVCTLFTAVPIILLSWLRSYRFLVPTSQLGLCALLFALVVTVIEAGGEFEWSAVGKDVVLIDFEHFPLFLGNAAFLYLISSVILPVEQGMRGRPRYRVSSGYVKALNWGMVIVTILNVFFAEFSYMSFGKGVCGNVIDNLEHGAWKSVVSVLLCADLFFTYALFLFPVSESLEKTLFDEDTFGERWVEMKRNAVRGVLVMATCGIALLVPSFEQLTGLTGAFGNNVLGLIMPPLMYFKLTKKGGPFDQNHSTAFKVFGYAISAFGIVMMFVCVAFFVEAIVSTSSSSTC